MASPTNLISGLIAYSFLPKKPAIKFETVRSNQIAILVVGLYLLFWAENRSEATTKNRGVVYLDLLQNQFGLDLNLKLNQTMEPTYQLAEK